MKGFNVLFDDAIFRDDWSESIVLPLFRKGIVNDPKHDRGSVIDVVSCAVPLQTTGYRS